jgi:poly-gamma-glutamate synthesis protein (capsule biosynthesis protein)
MIGSKTNLLLQAVLLVTVACAAAFPFPVNHSYPPITLTPGDTVENFERGTVQLLSYPGQDQQPNAWRVDSLLPHPGSRYSLKLHGNTWKTEQIESVAVDSGDVWQVSAYIDSVGEIQGFGVIDDSAHALMYCFAGTELLDIQDWVTVYQGAFPIRSWNLYQLPIADDWLARYGYLPTITKLLFINDRDQASHAVAYFDDIIDITDSLPVAPQVSITDSVGDVYLNSPGIQSVDVQFYGHVYDPDGGTHLFYWDFGDGATSVLQNPRHTFLVLDNHPYTVLLRAVDQTGLWGRASCQIQVDPGPTSFPIRMNFVGDIMMARRYEQVGGIIPTRGVEAIFAPTRSVLGDNADITVANLESALCNTGTRHPTKSIVFRSSPTNVAGLVYAGIDVVAIANNHVVDYGLQGLQQMQGVLRNSNIVFSGAGANSYEAYTPAFYSRSGVCIAFLASSDLTGQYNNWQPFLDAGFNKPGFANLTPYDLARQIDTVRNAADLVVVEMHSGVEYSFAPTVNQGQTGSAGDEGDEDYSPFLMAPLLTGIQTRQFAIDHGADLVICHHPHITQGFQVYRGKLIAHSLGNFAFDLDYPETMPTAILNASIDEIGFSEYSVTPVFIDDYIPMRARGEFGLHILDYLARRSKDLNTYLVVDSQSVTAAIVLDTLRLRPNVVSHTSQIQLQQQGSDWVSEPLRLARSGSLSSLASITPSASWQYRVGRDVIWFGNFENEGCTLWNINESDEGYDTTTSHAGRRSLLQRRTFASGTITTSFEKRIFCESDTARYSLYGYIKTSSANNAALKVNFYNSRTGTEIGTSDIGTQISGATDWTFYHREFAPTVGTTYFDMLITSDSPTSGTGRSWFDDAGIIAWSGWKPFNPSEIFSTPNDYYWVQIKSSLPTPNASVTYRETQYNDVSTSVKGEVASQPIGFELLQNYPNPFNPSTTIRYALPSAGHAMLRVYNILGQEVATLVDEIKRAGTHTVNWEPHTLTSGVYFYRLEAGGFVNTKKLLLLK